LKLKIKAGKPDTQAGEIGTLFSRMGSLFIGCGTGSYQVLELQEEGKKTVAHHDFSNGLRNRGIELPLKLAGKTRV
jgi:hypothetical protein